MNDKPGVMVGRRRGRAEIEQIVAEFAASGVRRTEFCRRHGMTLGTLHRYLKLCEQPDGGAAQDGLLAVELAGRTLAAAVWQWCYCMAAGLRWKQDLMRPLWSGW